MSTAHKFTPRHVNRLFGAVSEPQRDSQEPKMCTAHPAEVALRHANGIGFCRQCVNNGAAASEAGKR